GSMLTAATATPLIGVAAAEGVQFEKATCPRPLGRYVLDTQGTASPSCRVALSIAIARGVYRIPRSPEQLSHSGRVHFAELQGDHPGRPRFGTSSSRSVRISEAVRISTASRGRTVWWGI